jgi:hypothetical protein
VGSPAGLPLVQAQAKSPYQTKDNPIPNEKRGIYISLRNDYGEIILPVTTTVQLKRVRKAEKEGLKKFKAKLAKTYRNIKKAESEDLDYFNGDLLENLGRPPGTTFAELAQQWPCFDWRWGGVVPFARDQGECGSCWAYSATAAFESRLMINLNRFKLSKVEKSASMTQVCLSVQGILDCVANGDCAGGNPTMAFEHMVQCGARLLDYREDGMPFDDTKELMGKKGRCTEKEREGIKALAWGFVFADDPNLIPSDDASILKLKEALLEHGPLAVFVRKTDKFKQYTAAAYPPSGVFTEDDPGGVNHLVLLIGWDNAKRAWVILNSYGPHWGEACCDKAKVKNAFPAAANANIAIHNLTQNGEKGCMYIAWGTNKIGQLATWIEAPFEIPKRILAELRRKGKRQKSKMKK